MINDMTCCMSLKSSVSSEPMHSKCSLGSNSSGPVQRFSRRGTNLCFVTPSLNNEPDRWFLEVSMRGITRWSQAFKNTWMSLFLVNNCRNWLFAFENRHTLRSTFSQPTDLCNQRQWVRGFKGSKATKSCSLLFQQQTGSGSGSPWFIPLAPAALLSVDLFFLFTQAERRTNCLPVSFCSSVVQRQHLHDSSHQLLSAAAVSSDAAGVPDPGRVLRGDQVSPTRQSSSGRPGWSQQPPHTAAWGSLCPARDVCCAAERRKLWVWEKSGQTTCDSDGPQMNQMKKASSYLLWLRGRWTGSGRTVWTGAPSFSLASSKTSCSSGLLTQDTSFQWRTAENKSLISLRFNVAVPPEVITARLSFTSINTKHWFTFPPPI